MAGINKEFTYATCGKCGKLISMLNVSWYHEDTESKFCNRENDDMAFPIPKSITKTRPVIEDYSI